MSDWSAKACPSHMCTVVCSCNVWLPWIPLLIQHRYSRTLTRGTGKQMVSREGEVEEESQGGRIGTRYLESVM